MKKLIVLVMLIASSFSVYAGRYSYNCWMTDISCDGLFRDMVSDKFTAKFPHDRFEIFVYAKTHAFSDGSGVSYSIVGVVPMLNQSYKFFPNRVWRNVTYFKNVGDSYAQKSHSREVIRKSIQAMMADCDYSKNCDILE